MSLNHEQMLIQETNPKIRIPERDVTYIRISTFLFTYLQFRVLFYGGTWQRQGHAHFSSGRDFMKERRKKESAMI